MNAYEVFALASALALLATGMAFWALWRELRSGVWAVRFCWQHEPWASDFDEKQLRFPWLMGQLDTGLPPNLDDIRYTRRVLKYGASTYLQPPSHQVFEI